MASSQPFTLPQPLKCIDQSMLFASSVRGDGWRKEWRQQFWHIGISISLLAVTEWGDQAFQLESSNELLHLLFAVLPIFFRAISGYCLVFSLIRLYELKQMPDRRLPEERTIASNHFMKLNDTLAEYYELTLRKQTISCSHPGSYSQEERLALEEMLIELCQIDSQLSMVAQVRKSHAERARMAVQLNLGNRISQLLSRKLPAIEHD
ncbi:MAG: hypothetical protein UY72_C0016G0003 [Candidatus Uhrbacteria bacterium GW2011_GWD2_52_7]|uniref:Uncharacterized protein n=1 Tax=Candidatus Uhrbacteria bacterium GW2011_GWD2_52_7 TaxID=1618989 RepID=A0A0G1XH88_9BACT|nr:MAG: hypothetical protein UY72_C0016G0003 [Candidatus Uhrbacteria bacterium GW2011_GWD2_52_7]